MGPFRSISCQSTTAFNTGNLNLKRQIPCIIFCKPPPMPMATFHWWVSTPHGLILNTSKATAKAWLEPTFYGKISSLDIYQFSRHCAIHHSDTFPFTRKKQLETESFSFRLEDLATAFDCLDTPQTHDAKDDVLLTIELTKKLEHTFNTTLKEFYTQQHDTAAFNAPIVI